MGIRRRLREKMISNSFTLNTYLGRILVIFALVYVGPASARSSEVFFDDSVDLSANAATLIAEKIFHNECGSDQHCLVSWNEGERFPSLGIGHFIWYPKGIDEGYRESFPELIAFMQGQSLPVPHALQRLSPFDAPWGNRKEFLMRSHDTDVQQLRDFLSTHKAIQMKFMFRRAKQSWSDIVAASPPVRRPHTQSIIRQLLASDVGIYALIDYVNFKGEGLLTSEQINGTGWGLSQVLDAMDVESEDADIVGAFRVAAVKVLTHRAMNAKNPIERNRWLAVWKKRIQTYR